MPSALPSCRFTPGESVSLTTIYPVLHLQPFRSTQSCRHECRGWNQHSCGVVRGRHWSGIFTWREILPRTIPNLRLHFQTPTWQPEEPGDYFSKFHPLVLSWSFQNPLHPQISISLYGGTLLPGCSREGKSLDALNIMEVWGSCDLTWPCICHMTFTWLHILKVCSHDPTWTHRPLVRMELVLLTLMRWIILNMVICHASARGWFEPS